MNEKTASGAPDNIDYQRTMNVAKAHAVLARENADQPVKDAPISLWMFVVALGVALMAGAYIGQNSGAGFNIFGKNYKPEMPAGSAPPTEQVYDLKAHIKKGGEIYAACAACHGADGKGVSGKPPLAGSDLVTGSDERLAMILVHGLSGPIKVSGVDYNLPEVMNPGGGQPLDDKGTAQVLSFIRASWNNNASPIMADQIAELKARTKGHAMTTMADLDKIPADKMLPPTKKPIPGMPEFDQQATATPATPATTPANTPAPAQNK